MIELISTITIETMKWSNSYALPEPLTMGEIWDSLKRIGYRPDSVTLSCGHATVKFYNKTLENVYNELLQESNR